MCGFSGSGGGCGGSGVLTRGRARRARRAWAICVLAVAATALAAADAVAQVQVTQSSYVTLRWSAAAGPVVGYQVFVSRNGATAEDEAIVFTNEATIPGQPGETIRVAVRAYGFPYGPTQPFDWG